MSSRKPDSPPADLDKESQALWRRTIAHLEDQDTWSLVDLPVLERYIRAVELERQSRCEMTDAKSALTKQRLSKGSTGQLVVHPLETVRQKADADAHKYAEALLLTPAARRRYELEAASTKPKSKFGGAL